MANIIVIFMLISNIRDPEIRVTVFFFSSEDGFEEVSVQSVISDFNHVITQERTSREWLLSRRHPKQEKKQALLLIRLQS